MDDVTFNPLKHHVGYIRAFIQMGTWDDWRASISRLGNSLMDLYCGKLSVEHISDEVRAYLKAHDVLEKEKYEAWLATHRGYQVISLSDESVWVLRLGTEEESYIHFHPGRFSPLSIRVNANILKTVVTCGMCLRDGTISDLGVASINHVRTKVLDLPPIQKLRDDQALSKALKEVVTG